MNQLMINSTTIGVVISIAGYEIGVLLKNKFKCGVLNPLLISIILVMIFLGVFHIDYENYYRSARYISYLLTPATVCLAIPMYQQIILLKNNVVAILCGIMAGILSSLGCVWGLSVLFQLNHIEYVTLLPKSITTAIGIGVSEELGGYVTVTVAVIIITGVLGNISAEGICKLFHISNPIAKGVAIGSSSHAIGTAKAMEIGEAEGAISSLALVISGIGTVIGASIFAQLIY